MQVHEQVSMSAHIQFVCRLLRGARKLRFFMDQESGLRAAVMGAAASRIQDRTADAYLLISQLGDGFVMCCVTCALRQRSSLVIPLC